MPTEEQKPHARAPLVQWLSRANAELSSWAAGTSWWRMIVLFVVVLIAAQLIAEQLHLKHVSERVVSTSSKDGGIRITQVGPDGVRITRRRSEGNPADASPPDASPPSAKPPSASADRSEDAAEPMVPPIPRVRPPGSDEDEDDDQEPGPNIVTRTRWTPGGAIADLGATLIIILFAYLAAAKIVVRKVRQADEKVRSAEDAAGREAMERQLVQARLQVLQAQVEPHFLFNTLAAVDYLIETDPARASQMQKALITYLRGALPQMREESSTLGREMRLIRSYLELIKMRIEDRLEVQYDVPPDLDGAEFPPMMLQSLVENAIKHGIEPKPEGGTVVVASRVSKGQLIVEVRDTGIGIMDLDRLEAPTSGTGIGLQNIRERLSVLYSGRGHLSLMSDSHSGTTVRISVPYHPAQAGAPGAAPVAQPAA
ncbi:sensor histidine kinase [Ramlibacter algicola]|uniref:histidine kinase n=1 Tax=Ramlibacter algicola TaxID=2795217 RepID=A0A934URQ2_9BURK|nr:sensor histidine kinase [Ramlibacter algicola]MBK0393430.1 sensor histidine kinase [Ramlibacter algicola]